MDALKYATELVSIRSVSQKSNEPISRVVANHLERLGFQVEWLTYRDEAGELKVNVIGKRGSGEGGVAYLCHTDVVPADDWKLDFCGPFNPVVRDEKLYGRGACDMKGSLACALAAIEKIKPSEQTGPIYVVCTADEEIGTVGARQVDTQSKFFQEAVQGKALGIVGEPTMLQVVHAHKGGFAITVTARGISAHSSTASGVNANHALIPILPLLLDIQKQCERSTHLQSNMFDPPTLSWNMILRNTPEAMNITPSIAQACIFFRPMPGIDHQPLVDRVEHEAKKRGLEFHCVDKTPYWKVPSDAACVRFMLEQSGKSEATTVCYSTDGGVLSRLQNMVVCGPGDIAQAHRSDEFITLEQLNLGTDLYERVIRNWDRWRKANRTLESENSEDEFVSPESREDLEYVVRQATLDDLADVQAFLQYFVSQNKILRRTPAEIGTLLANAFLAEANGVVIGFSAVEIYSKKLGEIQCLAVSEKYQGKGIGSELVKRCVERARDKGILEVMAISSSESFLRNIGFDYSLPGQKRALFCQLRSREELFNNSDDD